jgi:hypothetical protein
MESTLYATPATIAFTRLPAVYGADVVAMCTIHRMVRQLPLHQAGDMNANTTYQRRPRKGSEGDATSDWVTFVSRLFVTVASVSAALAVLAFAVAILVRVLT